MTSPSAVHCASSSWRTMALFGIAASQSEQSEALLLSLRSVIALFILVLSVGACFGVWIGGRRRSNFCAHDMNSSATAAAARGKKRPRNGRLKRDCSFANNSEEEDGPTMVLRGSLELMASKWGVDRRSPRTDNRGCNGDDTDDEDDEDGGDESAVVRYLSPQQMSNLLFAKPTNENTAETLSLDEIMTSSPSPLEEDYPLLVDTLLKHLRSPLPSPSNSSSATDMTCSIHSESESSDDSFHDSNEHDTSTTDNSSITSTATNVSNNNKNNCSSSSSSLSIPQHQHHQQQISPQQFINLLTLIQKYSVNTSHPYFFNQLFGSLDPIALAAEIVALSVNTSVYTYETAPVFTLVEREVMGQIGKLVFGGSNNDNVDDEENNDGNRSRSEEENDSEQGKFEGEGLMIPGGSLANLTAMHAARHRWKVVNGYTSVRRSFSSSSGGGVRSQWRQQQQQQQRRELNAVINAGAAEDNDGNDYRYWIDTLNDFGVDENEEKKLDDISLNATTTTTNNYDDNSLLPSSSSSEQHLHIISDENQPEYDLVAFVSSEAHYSFSKSARVLGLREDDLIVIPTNDDGSMNVDALAKSIEELEYELEEVVKEEEEEEERCYVVKRRRRRRVPFFVACTAGSTVRGSFDDIAKIVKACRDYESRQHRRHQQRQILFTAHQQQQKLQRQHERSIWVHVDGAWGGSAIFSSRTEIRSKTHMDDIRHADSFTFNPHKMLGAPQQTTAFIVRHRNALQDANAAGAKYLFDPRKNGAEYDLGDLSYTCGRRTDAVKLWALWKYYGRSGLGARVDQKVDELECFVAEIRKRRNVFALACRPWPFNVNFFYFPPRIREILEQRGVLRPLGYGEYDTTGYENEDSFIQIPDDIAQDLADVSVALKLRLHEAGEMIIPFQPLSNQRADCFRLVVAGKKDLKQRDICHILDTMEKYGADL